MVGNRAELLGRSGYLSVRTAVSLSGQDAPMSFRIGGIHAPPAVSIHCRWRPVATAAGGATVGDAAFDATFVLAGPPAAGGEVSVVEPRLRQAEPPDVT